MIPLLLGYKEYADGYLVSEKGVIYSQKRNLQLKQRFHTVGYCQVTLWIKGNKKQQDKYVHRMVAELFIPNPENKPCVNHKNGIKTDNRAENLEWVTDSENQKHSYANGLNSRNGLNNGMSKLNYDIAHRIRAEYMMKNITGITQAKLAERYKVAENTIRQVIKNKTWVA